MPFAVERHRCQNQEFVANKKQGVFITSLNSPLFSIIYSVFMYPVFSIVSQVFQSRLKPPPGW